ncbi:phage holin family protein [Jiangella asiatica]|nr:phage holin family protein [Jiangella asiatica]
MVTQTTSDGAASSASIGQLVASIKDDLTTLVRDEIELAKAEMKEDAREAALGGGLLAFAAFLGVVAFILGSFALVYGVHALGLALGWSFLVVAGAYVLTALVLALLAKGRFGRMSRASRTKTTARDAARALTGSTDRT